MAQHQGMADAGRDQVGRMVLEAWDAFLAQAEAVDLEPLVAAAGLAGAGDLPCTWAAGRRTPRWPT